MRFTSKNYMTQLHTLHVKLYIYPCDVLNLDFATHPCKREYCKIGRERKGKSKLCSFHIRFVLYIEEIENYVIDKIS